MMAEEQGFEPWHTVTCLRAFQARPFSLLGIPPVFGFCVLVYPIREFYYIKNYSLLKEKNDRIMVYAEVHSK